MEGKSSKFFPVNQGVAQGCTFSPTLSLIYISSLLVEIEKHSELGIQFSGNTMSGLLFVDDFVEIAETGLTLRCLIGIAYNYSKHWQFEANVKRCAFVIFQN